MGRTLGAWFWICVAGTVSAQPAAMDRTRNAERHRYVLIHAGTFKHGTNAKEFEMMVGFGMTPMDAIHSATVATAELFGIADEAGTLEPGKLADLIAVTSDPLQDISALGSIDFVMKSGTIAKGMAS